MFIVILSYLVGFCVLIKNLFISDLEVKILVYLGRRWFFFFEFGIVILEKYKNKFYRDNKEIS